jgi:hypothetical protein
MLLNALLFIGIHIDSVSLEASQALFDTQAKMETVLHVLELHVPVGISDEIARSVQSGKHWTNDLVIPA